MKSQPTKLSKIKHALSWPTKSGDSVGRQNRAIFAWHDRLLSGYFVGR